MRYVLALANAVPSGVEHRSIGRSLNRSYSDGSSAQSELGCCLPDSVQYEDEMARMGDVLKHRHLF